ncbi:sensor histidine kinase [Ktedonosporobacter rubrisoli]|nr:sensor histidine kinase [Ktedonosporobacter rubrisoli]
MLLDICLFEEGPKDEGTEHRPGLWSNIRAVRGIPRIFFTGDLLFSDLAALFLAVYIVVTSLSMPLPLLVLTESIYLILAVLIIASRGLNRFPLVFLMYCAALLCSLLLNVLVPNNWGAYGLYTICGLVLYRFPRRWSLPLIAADILILLATNHHLQNPWQWSNLESLLLSFGIAVAIGWGGWSQRTQYLLVARLHEVQEQLRVEMERTRELAAEHERTRIARDIHDVLSHTLSVLSIQVQAARHLLKRDPERLTAKLDDMAVLIRESIAESRRVVGLLREPSSVQASAPDSVGAGLRNTLTLFSERTGIRCKFEEAGTPSALSQEQIETLHYALREILTNAHRHGAARNVLITLRWREAAVILQGRDDGRGEAASASGPLSDKISMGSGGHHGLQGMRERANALGGELAAGPGEAGGFEVILRLPFNSSEQLQINSR